VYSWKARLEVKNFRHPDDAGVLSRRGHLGEIVVVGEGAAVGEDRCTKHLGASLVKGRVDVLADRVEPLAVRGLEIAWIGLGHPDKPARIAWSDIERVRFGFEIAVPAADEQPPRMASRLQRREPHHPSGPA